MARVELIMPKMGESVSEATIITWSKEVGEHVELDETIVEIATDKVDSEVPSTHEGKLIEKLFEADDLVQVGEAFAILETEGGEEVKETAAENPAIEEKSEAENKPQEQTNIVTTQEKVVVKNSSDRFYSPLVRSMATKEGIGIDELNEIPGSGKDGRVSKSDMISYLKNRDIAKTQTSNVAETSSVKVNEAPKMEDKIEILKETTQTKSSTKIPNTGDVEIVEMDRMRKLISAHMTMSKSTSAHITSFVEADMTNIVNWRNSVKEDFKAREGQNITFTPIIICLLYTSPSPRDRG